MTPKPKRPHSPDEDSLDKPSLPPPSGVTRGSSKAKKRSKMDSALASGQSKNLLQLQTDAQSFSTGASNPHEKNKVPLKDAYKMNPKRASSLSSGPSSRISSEITSPEDTGNPSEVDVAQLRNWWATLHPKGRCCGHCGNELHFESVTTETLRNQLDSIYRIKNAVRNAEKAEKHRKDMEEKTREETISKLARWSRVRRLASGNSPSVSKTDLEIDKENIEDGNKEKEKGSGNTQDGKSGKDAKGKGKEREDKPNAKKLSQIFGTECCSKCRTYFCIACLKPVKSESEQKWEDQNGAKNPDGNDTSSRTSEHSFRDDKRLWCCGDGRLVAMLLCLGIIDEEFLGLSPNGNSLSSTSAGRGIKGTLRRSLRSLKDKITDGTHPAKPPVPRPERKARAKGAKDKGTGYGSGTYTASMFGFETSDSMDWDLPEDESDFDDGPLMFSDLGFPVTESGIGKLSEKIAAQVAALSGPPMTSVKAGGTTHNSQAQPEPTPAPKIQPPPGLSTPEGLPLASASAQISPNQQFQPPIGPSTAEGVPLTSALLQLPSEYSFQPSHGFPIANGFPLTAPPPYSPSSAAIKEPTNPNAPQIPKVYPYHGFGLGRGTSPLGGLPYGLPHVPPYPAIKPPIAPSHQYHPAFFQNPGAPLAYPPSGSSSAKDPLPNPVVESTPGLPIFPSTTGPPLSASDMMQHIKSCIAQYPEAALSPLGYIPSYIPASSDPDNASAFLEGLDTPSGFTDDGTGGPYLWPGPSETFQPRFKPQAIPTHPPLSSKQIMHDKTLYAVIRTLIRLLSDSGSENELQYVMSDVALSMLRASMLAEKIEELLRNDSIQDISIHSEVYLALVALLNRLSDSPSLEFLILENRRSKLFTSGIMKITQSKPVIDILVEIGPKTRGKAAAAVEERKRAEVLMYEDGFSRHSMVQVMSKLSTQARVFLKCVGKTKGDEFEGTEAAKTLKICMEIAAIGDKFLNLASCNANNKNGSSFTSSKSIEAPPQTRTPPPALVLDLGYHDGMAFEYIEGVVATHYWNLQATSLAASPRGRVLHLSREMATMSTSLPQGVFVRVEDGRPDIIKAMIVGPCETPYEGGLYEFDIWAPANYPGGPPMCQFKTTGNGTVHFNPNLYNCGKVCLSILNTWSGASSERWQPGTSTLLQVFVSIQSMILCATPWYNEPGRREGTRKKDAEEFNGRVRVNNVKWAMLDWLRDSSKRNGIWKDVIEAHFKANQGYLLDLVKEWAKKDPRLTNSKANVGSNKWSPYEDASAIAQNYVLALEEEFTKL